MSGSVPNIDQVGTKVTSPEGLSSLRREVAQLLGRSNENFPGAQPVSFSRKHLRDLRERDYFLCEKSDGIRCLLLFTRDHSNPSTPEAHYLIDRKNNYYHVPSLHFPRAPDPGHETNFSSYHYDTILDGELLYDTYPTGERILKYLVFDCLVIDGHNICSNTLDKRVAHFYEKILKPYEELWTRFREDCEAQFAFRIQRKSTERAYGTEMMFRDVIPRLKHGSDGLIFTCRETPYKFGTDENILKWKPAEENSIDFKMDLEFPRVVEAQPNGEANGTSPPNSDHDTNPNYDYDYDALPTFNLLIYRGDDNRGRDPDEHYGTLYMTPTEWAAMKQHAITTNSGLDGAIVECHKETVGPHSAVKQDGASPGRAGSQARAREGEGEGEGDGAGQGRWRFNRFRPDKSEANHISVAGKVLESIEDAVSREELVAMTVEVRRCWKEREARGGGGAAAAPRAR